MVLFRLAKEEKNTKISTLPHTSPRIHLQSIAPRTAPGTVFRNNWVFLQSAHMSENRSNQVFLFFINEKHEKSMARGFSIFSREFGAGGPKMHLSNESNLASGPTFPRSRVMFYNSNQDPKGGGIAGVDVEFFVGLRSL